MQVKLHLSPMVIGKDARTKFRLAIRTAFRDVVRTRKGQLEAAASEIGVARQSLEQYAEGTIPRADVLLTAIVRWGLKIRIEDSDAAEIQQRWWECSASRGSLQMHTTPSKPEQLLLPLSQAIEDLGDEDVDLKILRKSPGRIELGVKIQFPRRLL